MIMSSVNQGLAEALRALRENVSSAITPRGERLIAQVDAALARYDESESARQDLIERLKAQATAHRYMSETESADLLDEAIAVIGNR